MFPLKSPETSGPPREFPPAYLYFGHIVYSPQLATLATNCLTTSRHSNPQIGKVVIKNGPTERFENERNVLKHFQGQPYIRQMLDETKDPPSMVLKHLDDNLLNASAERAIEDLDVKFVAKRVLQALHALHEDGYTHTSRL